MSPRPACLSPSSSCISWLLGDLYQATSKPPPKNSPAPCVVKHSPSSSFLSPGKQEDDSRVMMYSALQVPFED